MIREYLSKKILICDGAMGTYYSELTGNDVSYCEFANLNDRETIFKIHKEYINAGAKLIRTNTFSANTHDLGVTINTLREIIHSGINIAKEACEGKEIFIGASIGPIRENEIEEDNNKILDEYKFIIDCFLEKGIDIFIFETLSNYDFLMEISKYIKEKNKNAFVLTQFAIKPDGFTRDGIGIKRIIAEVKLIAHIDVYGFNCGSGPTHLYEIIKNCDIDGDIVSALPNAGFPEIIHERTIYSNNPMYFAKKIEKILYKGISIVGGCCGTRPEYIRQLSQLINNNEIVNLYSENIKKTNTLNEGVENTFKEKLENNQFVNIVELSAPINTDISKLILNAKICKENNIDLVTVPDSPMSRVRADSGIIATKIKREIGIEVMPHICCRDKNVNAIRSSIIGCHIEGIRNILAITGDPISDANKIQTRSVFNLNSFKLIELIKEMNSEIFNDDNIFIGGALNLNVRNKEVEYNRMMKKIKSGVNFFLTQPIYDEKSLEFLRKIKEETNVKIIGGLLPIVSYRNAMFLNNELPGVKIPDEYINMFSEDMTKEEAQKIGTDIAVNIGIRLKEICDGLYFIAPFNRVNMIIDIINEINNN